MGIIPVPFSELFQVHGNKSKFHPVRNLSQACVSGISHAMFLFGICKNTLNGFFPCFVHSLVDRSVPNIVSHFFVFFPDVSGNRFNAVFVFCIKMFGGTVGTYFGIILMLPAAIPVGGGTVVQYLILWTDDAVKMFVIHISIPGIAALHGLGTLIGCG